MTLIKSSLLSEMSQTKSPWSASLSAFLSSLSYNRTQRLPQHKVPKPFDNLPTDNMVMTVRAIFQELI